MIARLRGYLIAGLLVWVPLGITVLVVKFLVGLMDRTVLLRRLVEAKSILPHTSKL